MFHKVFIASLLLVTPAAAHDAPLGWRYRAECCSTIDCWQEKDGAIKETLNGYRVVATGELFHTATPASSDQRISSFIAVLPQVPHP